MLGLVSVNHFYASWISKQLCYLPSPILLATRFLYTDDDSHLSTITDSDSQQHLALCTLVYFFAESFFP